MKKPVHKKHTVTKQSSKFSVLEVILQTSAMEDVLNF